MALGGDDVCVHELILAELAVGSIRDREGFIELLHTFPLVPRASQSEFGYFVNQHTLWGKGLSAVDVHLLASASLTPGVTLWTRDKRLRTTADALGIGSPLC